MINSNQWIDEIYNNYGHLSPKKQIQQRTKRFENQSIADIFQVSPNEEYEVISHKNSLQVGDIVNLDENLQVLHENQYKCGFHILDFDKYKDTGIRGTVVVSVDKIRNIVNLSMEEYAIQNYLTELINNLSNQRSYEPRAIEVRQLQLVKGGYKGKAILYPFENSDLYVEYNTFIPGSHIELNAISDFESYNGKSVFGFVYGFKPENTHKLIISCREYQKHLGNLQLMEVYHKWCDNKKPWKDISKKIYTGRVTGVMNSSKVRGVYVEIKELNTSFLKSISHTEDLLQYRFNDEVSVKFKGFENHTSFDTLAQQDQTKIPFEWKDGVLEKINVSPIFEII